MDTGMDPEVKKYFRKIINSFAVGLLWMLVIATSAFYFDLAIVHEVIRWYNYLFYFIFLTSLFFLIRFYYRLWKD
jgi:hypothetical protein